MQEPRIVTVSDIKLIGKSIQTSLSENRTVELWKSFRPLIKDLPDIENARLFSIQIFEKGLDFESFTPTTRFEKWAAIEINDLIELPDNVDEYIIKGGKYAVFIHKGTASEFPRTSGYIHQKWLPESFYELDDRPHFEVMKPDYNPNDPDAEEEIWIPIKQSDLDSNF